MRPKLLISGAFLLCFFLQVWGESIVIRGESIVDRISPPIEVIDSLRVDCQILEKRPPFGRVIEMVAMVVPHDTLYITANYEGAPYLKPFLFTSNIIQIAADYQVSAKFNVREWYALSLVEVKTFHIKCVRNGILGWVIFDDGKDYWTRIASVNRMDPPLYLLLENRGVLKKEKRATCLQTASTEDLNAPFVTKKLKDNEDTSCT